MIKSKTGYIYKTGNKSASRASRLPAIILSAVVMFITVTSAISVPVQAAAVTAQSGTARYELHAFYPADAVFSDQMKKYIDSLDSLSFAWSRVDPADPDALNSTKGQNGNFSFYYPSDYLQSLNYAKSKGKSIQLNVFANNSDAVQLLPYADKRTALINTIITQMDTVAPMVKGPQGNGSQGSNQQGDGSQPTSPQGTTPQGNNLQGSTPQETTPQGTTPQETILQPTGSQPTTQGAVPQPTGSQPTTQGAVPQPSGSQPITQGTVSQPAGSQPTTTRGTASQNIGFSFDGVVMDFEGLKDTDDSGAKVLDGGQTISAYYVQFLKELKIRLQAEGKHLYVAVNPRLFFDGFDYRSILETADRVIIMAHDYETTNALRKDQILQFTGYSPVTVDSPAPLQRVKQALDDIKKSASGPSGLSKVWLQVLFSGSQWEYGINGPNDWDSLDSAALSAGGRSRPSYSFINDRVNNIDGQGANITYGYNNQLQSPFIQYFNTFRKTWNVILYEDSTSIGAKMDLAKSYGLGGISVWSLKNIPDYNDAKGKQFHLDVWDTVLTKIKTPYTPPAGSGTSVKFADKAVEKAVRDNLGKPSGNITAYDVKCVYRLKLPAGVKSLADLKMLVNLEYLDASGLGLNDISPLASLANLRVLDLEGNMFSNISVLKKLVKLQILTISKNKVTDLQPLAALPDLRELYASGMGLRNLKVIGGLKPLGKLNLDGNGITDITPVSGLKKLYSLSLDTNSISNIKVLSGLTGLRRLVLTNNRITDIQPLKNLNGLELLYISGNSVIDLRPLSGLPGLSDLSFNRNKVTDVKPLASLSKLEELYMKDNKVKDLSPLKGLASLHILYISGNPVTDPSQLDDMYSQLTESDLQ